MRAASIFIAVFIVAGAARADDAVALEEQAFTAIEGEQWCLAMRLFEGAHAQGPAVGLLQNAAQAGEFGGDLASALGFYEAILKFPSSSAAEKATAKKKAAELTKKLARSPGTRCPTLDELRPKPAPAPTPTTTAPTSTEPPAPAPEPVDVNSYGVIAAGIGGAALVVGAATAGVGLVPWFTHADAVTQIEQAERDKADATALQAKQTAARAAWESYGQALTVAGGIVLGVGVVVAGGGLGLTLFGAPDEP